MEIKGYAAVFNSPETYSYTEVIDSKAFDEADMSDVVLRYNHEDTFMVLARTRNKSLKLNVDEKGLFMDATLQDDIQQHRDIFNAIKSGLIDKPLWKSCGIVKFSTLVVLNIYCLNFVAPLTKAPAIEPVRFSPVSNLIIEDAPVKQLL